MESPTLSLWGTWYRPHGILQGSSRQTSVHFYRGICLWGSSNLPPRDEKALLSVWMSVSRLVKSLINKPITVLRRLTFIFLEHLVLTPPSQTWRRLGAGGHSTDPWWGGPGTPPGERRNLDRLGSPCCTVWLLSGWVPQKLGFSGRAWRVSFLQCYNLVNRSGRNELRVLWKWSWCSDPRRREYFPKKWFLTFP